MWLRNVRQHLQGMKSSLRTRSNSLTNIMPWIQASFILIVYVYSLIRDRSMLFLLPIVLGAAICMYFLVRASLLQKPVAMVILFIVTVIGLELIFQMSNSNLAIFIVGTILYISMLIHNYFLSSPWEETVSALKHKYTYITVIILNTIFQIVTSVFEYQKHGESWMGPPLQKYRFILFFLLYVLLTVLFLVHPNEFSAKLCFLTNIILNISVTRNLIVTLIASVISAFVFFFKKSPVYQIISLSINEYNEQIDDSTR